MSIEVIVNLDIQQSRKIIKWANSIITFLF